MKRAVAIGLCIVLVGTLSLAAPRTWKSSNGRFKIDAELLDFKDGKAQLKKGDGTIIDVPLLSLCAEDQKFVKEQMPGVEQENFRPGAEYREWKSKNGKFSALAEFMHCVDGEVQLRKPDGSELSVEKKLLSAADQRWIAEELRRLHEEDADSKSEEKSDKSEKNGKSDKKEKDKSASQEVTGPIDDQDILMKLVRLEQNGKGKKKSRAKGGIPSDYIYRLTAPQQFFLQLSKGNANNETDFQNAVKTQPKYNAPIPLRGLAKLGSGSYCFALDLAKSQSTGYDRLYFDANGDGDLTDDKPIEASSVTTPSPGIVQSQFPAVDVTLDVEGKKLNYSFVMNAICRRTGNDAYATASLYSAVVREGSITQGTKQTKLLLVDHNSNGRFDDSITIKPGGTPAEGDLLLVNPNPKNNLSADATMGRDRNFVSKTVCLGKDFYKMEVTPSGESVKLTPTKLDLGNVTNGSPGYRAVLFCEDFGVLMLGGMKDQKIPLPAGEWKVLNYTIDTGGAGTSVTATFGDEPSVVSVEKGKTVKLPFGAPYHAVVTARRTNASQVSLSLAISGVGGERCTSFYINKSRPPKPLFIVKDKDGKMVHQGSFEYG